MPEHDQDKPLRSGNGEFRIRITAKFKEVARIMATQGLDIDTAAQQAEANVKAMRRAFKRPHNKAYVNQLIAEVRDNAAQAAYLRINHMSKTAASEHVRLDANKFVAGVDGIAPVQKVSGTHTVNHSFGGFEYPTIDVTPDSVTDADDDKGDK